VKRREFITLLGGAVAWPIATPAQPERVRRIGVLLPASANDNAFQDRIGAFLQGLQQSGWTIGGNVRIDTRWATNNPNEIRRHAAELAALAPDVVVALRPRLLGRCYRRRALCRSCFQALPIRWPPGSSTAWLGRAATRQASSCSSTAWRGNWLSC
jgi:hypothetical protein